MNPRLCKQHAALVAACSRLLLPALCHSALDGGRQGAHEDWDVHACVRRSAQPRPLIARQRRPPIQARVRRVIKAHKQHVSLTRHAMQSHEAVLSQTPALILGTSDHVDIVTRGERVLGAPIAKSR
jgi:hypothetical protein